MSDYLWDRTGKDAEVEALENLLRPLALAPRRAPRGSRAGVSGVVLALLAAAALVAISALVAVKPGVSTVPAPNVLVKTFEGTVPCNQGSWVSVPRGGVVDLGALGNVTAEPDAKLQVVSLSPDLKKLRLERGTIHATISGEARPRLFQVETPVTTCVDLGCEYDLTVDDLGHALVTVKKGKVAFTDGRREVFVPRDAVCRATARGAGTPVWADSKAPLVEALEAYDAAPPRERVAAARVVAARCVKQEDSLMLWHLLQDEQRDVASVALAQLLALKVAPEGISCEATLRRDPATLEAWRDFLRRFWY